MFDCYIHLCAFVYSVDNPGVPYAISTDNKKYLPPKYKVTRQDRCIKDCILNLIDDCINQNPKDINTFLMDVVLDDTDLNIYYTCILPIDSKMHNIHKISIQLLMNNPLARRALRYV